jgi:hypothetical protein
VSVESREILSQFLETIRNEILAEHIRQGQRVTGKTLESFEINVNDTKGTLSAAAYVGVLEEGRRPGGFPPVSKIEQWIIDRGIIPKGKISITSLAFIMARKISVEGTRLNQAGGNSGVLSKALNEDRINTLLESLAQKYIVDYSSEVISEFK